MKRFIWPTPGILAQLNYCKCHKCPKLTQEMLDTFLTNLTSKK